MNNPNAQPLTGQEISRLEAEAFSYANSSVEVASMSPRAPEAVGEAVMTAATVRPEAPVLSKYDLEIGIQQVLRVGELAEYFRTEEVSMAAQQRSDELSSRRRLRTRRKGGGMPKAA